MTSSEKNLFFVKFGQSLTSRHWQLEVQLGSCTVIASITHRRGASGVQRHAVGGGRCLTSSRLTYKVRRRHWQSAQSLRLNRLPHRNVDEMGMIAKKIFET